MSIIKLRLLDGRNPLGMTRVIIEKQAVRRVANNGDAEFVASDNQLRDIEDRLRSWRLDVYGLEAKEVQARNVRVDDILPCLGMKVKTRGRITPDNDNSDVTLTGYDGTYIRLNPNHMLTIHRRTP